MKTLNKKKLFKNVFYVFGLSCVLGLSSCSSYNYDYKEDNNYQYEEKLNRKNITYDDSTYSISYDNSDLEDYSYWDDVYDTLFTNNYTNTNKMSITGRINLTNSQNLQYAYAYSVSNSTNAIYYVCFTINNYDGIRYVKSTTNGEIDSRSFESMGGLDMSGFTGFTVTSETYYNLIAPQPQDDMPQVLNDFVSILVGGIQQLAVGIANGVVSMASALFLNVEGGVVTGLSLFGGIVAIFSGLALAVGITTRVYFWITRLGKD